MPPEFGDAVACICSDGSLLLWEEIVEGILLNYIYFSTSCALWACDN